MANAVLRINAQTDIEVELSRIRDRVGKSLAEPQLGALMTRVDEIARSVKANGMKLQAVGSQLSTRQTVTEDGTSVEIVAEFGTKRGVFARLLGAIGLK
ncbi:MAG: hypothetical protein ACFHWZ_15430 [Phycisphaerales bacterium]